MTGTLGLVDTLELLR